MQTKKDEKITFPPLIIKEITPCLFLYMSTLQSDFLGEFHWKTELKGLQMLEKKTSKY